jgi:drug/metabolite transporter (DMT)-like permease
MVFGASQLWTDCRAVGGRLPFNDGACDTASQMDMPSTLALAAGLLTLAAFAGWRGARPPNPHRGPRLMPWRFLMLAATACLVFVLGHLVQMLSGTTGS